MGRTLEYPKRAANTIKRYNSRGTYGLGAIHTLINETSVLHVSFPPNPDVPFPVVLPMIGTMGSFEYPSSSIDEPLDCYLHGYVSARMSRLAKESEKGLPVTIAATKVDGLVLSLTPNSHSYNYRSAVLQGWAKPVETVEEKVWAMELITNSVVPSRYSNTRNPPDNAEMTSTMIIKVTIESGSGKIRNGGPHDDAKDENRPEITDNVWTGVIPVWETFGEPIPAATNKVAQLPEYISSYTNSTSKHNEAFAKKATEER